MLTLFFFFSFFFNYDLRHFWNQRAVLLILGCKNGHGNMVLRSIWCWGVIDRKIMRNLAREKEIKYGRAVVDGWLSLHTCGEKRGGGCPSAFIYTFLLSAFLMDLSCNMQCRCFLNWGLQGIYTCNMSLWYSKWQFLRSIKVGFFFYVWKRIKTNGVQFVAAEW